MQKLKEILATTVEASEGPSTSSSWSLRQSAAQDEWQKARPYHLDCLLFSRVVKENKCSQCSSPAIIRCRDCMPEEWLCMECDLICHKKLALHNRESCIDRFYRPIPPTMCCAKENGRYTLKNQVRLLPTVRPDRLCTCGPSNITESAGRATILICINVDVFSTFEEMKTVAPGLSRQDFLRLLEQRTQQFGRAVRKAEVESQRLENLSRELRCPENMVQQWVHDVRQWATDDSNKIRQLRRRKLGDEKRKLFEAIKQYNEQVPEEEGINEEMVESRLSVVGHASGEEILIWPWEVHSTESTNILTKKIFDAYMSKMRLQEEKILILREMRQHCTYLRGLADSIRKLIAEMSGGNRGSLTEEGHCGLCCLLQEKLADVEEKFQVVSSRYSLALGPLYPEDWSKEIPDESKRLEYESSEDSDSEDD
ncbi:hypothetical protein ROHU_009549 [Labeo rohita]|uniref:Uncharacterized protein n=1 Tax=Labeo rohita TaxID=84645 RepID=A0A498LYN3_LABRO|nr:hypothetical protein ROHU_009549 [Labeo rohita]